MRRLFNTMMRIVSSVLGLLMIAMGGIWILQGLNLAFNGPMMGGQPSFMVGDNHWVLFGAILALVGVCQLIWSTHDKVSRKFDLTRGDVRSMSRTERHRLPKSAHSCQTDCTEKAGRSGRPEML